MPRVLVVEDSPTQAQRFALVLGDEGFTVEVASDAERGFERLASGGIDVVLSDLNLPGGSGFDLCRRVKADAALCRLPVVVCTAQADPLNVLRGLQAGADGFLTKDREPSEIVGCLRRVLERCPPEAVPEPVRVACLGQEFRIAADREQLVGILVTAFEELVGLNDRYRQGAAALLELNRQLEARNADLQRLAESERQAHEELKRAESQLVQVEKLSALGQMVAGVAHEINNPLAFVTNNLSVLRRDVASALDVLRMYQEADAVLAEHRPELLGRIQQQIEEVDLPYTLEHLDGMVTRSAEGLKRIQRIVGNLRDFARLDESERKEVDLNEGIRSTIGIIRSRADQLQVALETDLAPLPKVTCYPAKINQVVLNLIANAIDACPKGGRVRVATRPTADGVAIDVEDNGAGIDPAIGDKVFDPFFTTKPVGQGTGLGLSISYGIVQAHGGRIAFESEPGRGTRFTVSLPMVCESGSRQ